MGDIPFEQTYHGRLRAALGNNQRIITPAARAVIHNDRGELLLIRRSDNGNWALPAGTMELGDSVLDCLRREVVEETGLTVQQATLFAIHSEPRFHFSNAYGGLHQTLTFSFSVDSWSGTLVTETDESTDARFFPVHELPQISEAHRETLEDLRAFDGIVILK